MLEFIESNLKGYATLVAALGTPFAAWVGAKLLGFLLSLFSLRKVHQIISPDDPALDAVEEIQRIRFPIEERDPEGILTQKIAASDFSFFGKPRSEAVMIVLYYKVGGEITAYLTAEYFRKTRTIFFWYIAMRGDDKADDGHDAEALSQPIDPKAARHMVTKLLAICRRLGGWNHVIAEVDSRQWLNAVTRLRRFQQYAWRLRYRNFNDPRQWWDQLMRWLRFRNEAPPPSVFKVDVDFRMPLHEASLVFEAEQHETPAWLVVAPFDNMSLSRTNPVIARDQVVTLLDALRRSYNDPEEPDFNAYIARFYDGIVAGLPEQCRLVSRFSDATGGQRMPRRPKADSTA